MAHECLDELFHGHQVDVVGAAEQGSNDNRRVGQYRIGYPEHFESYHCHIARETKMNMGWWDSSSC
ncbi:hypothetical protein PG993_014311 [Apiospora rasikravindrae]|uniref:Uncharacterized protein n=1 Tax=Apiospora rasikravindrae TaxID=990691 RepID=A0ABR1RMN2_9PEZI